MRTRAGAGLLVAALSLASPAWAQEVDEPAEPPPTAPLPRAVWYTLQTPHFDVHFYPDEQALAQRIAHFAERAWRLNTRYFNWRPGRARPVDGQRLRRRRERVGELDPVHLHQRLWGAARTRSTS